MHSVIWVLMAVVVVWGLAAQRVPGLVWATVLASAIALAEVNRSDFLGGCFV